nr:glycosyltransferase [Intestinimonas butyriciproducens]
MPSRDYQSTKPEVSVLLPTFRRAKSGLFENAVQSVLNQDFDNLELIIIDDGSTDGTEELIAHFMKNDSRISCIRHQYNIGLPAISEYEGYMRARGEYIAFIFDDNEWERDYISRTINFMIRNHAKAAYGRIRSYYGDENQYKELGISNFDLGVHALCAVNHIANGGVILSRDVIETVGLYDPHVVMTRFCDWNLWKRINKKYTLFETGILAGVEKGYIQSDSLGNSYKQNGWAMAERENIQSDLMFIPKNYQELEVNEVSEENTKSYIEATQNFYAFFSDKKWYKKESFALQSSGRSLRLLVISHGFDASVEISFERLIGTSSSLIFKFVNSAVPLYEIVEADAVVLMRNLIALNRFKSICTFLNIPCYYYIDDNFEILSQDKTNPVFRQLASYWTKENMNEFSGIFTSTAAMKKFMEEKRLNRHIAVLEPVMSSDDPKVFQQNLPGDGTLVFAYLGGGFRDQQLIKTVLPALERLSEIRPVHLLCPDRIKFSKRYLEMDNNIEITQFPFTFLLEEALRRYASYRPQYLIHCGPSIPNNEYKTENAMMNAVNLGSVLIISRMAQYEQSAKEGRCVDVDDNSEEWYHTFKWLVENQNKTKEIYDRARDYCCRRYAAREAISTLETALQRTGKARQFDVVERYNNVLFDILYNASRKLTIDSSGILIQENERRRSLSEVPLCYSGGIEKERVYHVMCNVDKLSKIGICFGSLGIPEGQVNIQLCTQNRVLREATLDFMEYAHDDWTYISFEPIEKILNVELCIRLTFEYAQGSDLVGVFEDSTKRSILYRLSNKLGHPLPVKDLLYVDLQ